MERHKLDLATEYCNGILRNYPMWPSTFGPCRDMCGNSGRGSGLCADCSEKELAKVVGYSLANEYHLSIQNTTRLWREIYDKLDE
ncbi:MAG: hypothetical protein GY714_01800 [Desulfobacterales bacterium]|nr:hypothetical protein [Desulfobacterales bacterium]